MQYKMNENVNKPSAYEQCCHNTICAEGKKTQKNSNVETFIRM